MAQIETYARLRLDASARLRSFREEGVALIEQSMSQTQGMIDRFMKATEDHIEESGRETKQYVDRQHQEKLASLRRLELASMRRGEAIEALARQLRLGEA